MSVGDWIGDHWEKFRNGLVGLNTDYMTFTPDLLNIAFSGEDDSVKDRAINAWTHTLKFGQQQAGHAGNVLSPVLDIPPVKWTGEKLTWLQKTLVNRPLAAAALAADTADREDGFLNQLGSWDNFDTWRTAWNDSRKVTAGQALTYDAAQLLGIVDPNDPAFDPRKSKDAYYDDWFFQTTSGGIDFSLAFADPLRGASKLARLTKLKFYDKAVTADQITKGALERQTFGKHAQVGQSFDESGGVLAPGTNALYEQARAAVAADRQDDFTRLYFNQYAHGGLLATNLTAAAEAGDKSLFADILMSARGSGPATQRLSTAPGLAPFMDAMGRQRTPFNAANITARQAEDPFAWEVAAAKDASAELAIVDNIAYSAPTPAMIPQAGPFQSVPNAIIGRGTPKVRPKWDAFRTGIHNYGNGSYAPIQVVGAAPEVLAKGGRLLPRATRIFDRTRGYAAHINLNEPGSYRSFRANLERASRYVDEDTRNKYMTAYMSAATAFDRSKVASMADNFVIGKMAQAHGMSAADAERLIKAASMRRETFRNMLNSSTKFLPAVFKDRANKLLREGNRAEASRLVEYSMWYEQEAKAGRVPGYYDMAVDDMGNPIMVMREDWENPLRVAQIDRATSSPILTGKDPLLASQTADRLPMVDYVAFDRALRTFAKPRLTIERYEADLARVADGKPAEYPEITADAYNKARAARAMSSTRSTVTDIYDAFNHVWSIAAVLRPAQTLRTLADDGTRAITMMGILPSLLSGTTGLYRIGYNLAARSGMTWMQERSLDRARRALTGETHHTIEVDDVGEHAASGSESSSFYNYIDPRGTSAPMKMGADEVYPTLEAALVAGRIDLSTFVAYVPWAARNARLPEDLDAIVWDWKNGQWGKPEGIRATARLRQEIVEYLADTTGTLSFTFPRWQQDAADAINDMAMRRRTPRRNPGMILDPLNDEASYLVGRGAEDKWEHTAHRYLHRNPESGQFDDLDGLYKFVADHAEKFLFGNYKLHAKFVDDGRLRLSVARDLGKPRPIAERLSEVQKKEQLKGLKARGSDGVRLVDGKRTVTIPGVFSGMDGEYARAAASASYIPRGMTKAARNADRAAQWNAKVDKKDITPFVEDSEGKAFPNKDWDPAWERMANKQLANDAAARMLLQGMDEAQVLAWLDGESPSALRYLNDTPALGLSVDQHVSSVRALVDYLAPPTAGQELRDKILNHEAVGADIRRAVSDKKLPAVNGHVTEVTLRTHPVIKWAGRQLDNWFHFMQDKPADFLVRYPFIDNRYRMYFEPAYDAYIKQTPGHFVHQADIDEMSRMAKMKALDDTKRYLYDQTFRSDLAGALSPMMPFSNAIADSLFKWTKIAYERPLDTLANWNLIYNWPERNGLVYDQDGNSLGIDENGNEVWHSALDGQVMPDDVHHDKYVAFQVPSWISNKIGGLKLAQFNKASMTSAIFDPSVNVGPLVALPVNQFALANPEVGENTFVKNFVLPFGPTSDTTKSVLPGLIRSSYQWYNEDESKASSAAMAIYQTQLTDYMLHKRSTPPDIEDAKRQAGYEQGLRFMTSAVSPISFQYNTPYKPYIDMYSQLLRKYNGDDNKAMSDFRALAGHEYIYLAARVTKSNIALPSTIKGYQAFKQKQDMIQKFPELAGLITGADGAGSFSKSVYEWEKQQTYDETGKTIRQEQTIADSIADVEARSTWDEYTKFNAHLQNDLSRRGIFSINTRGAEDLKQAYDQWIQAHAFHVGPNGEIETTAWYKDFKSLDTEKMENRITQMRELLILNPDWLQGRDDLQGLAKYLNARDYIQQAMKLYGLKKFKTNIDQNYDPVQANRSEWLQNQWQNVIFDFKQENPAFGQLYDRWLSRDDLTAEGIVASDLIIMLEKTGRTRGD